MVFSESFYPPQFHKLAQMVKELSQLFKPDFRLPKKFELFAWLKVVFILFHLKSFFVVKIFKFWWWLFGHVEKTDWLQRENSLQNWWSQSLVYKQLLQPNCPIPQKSQETQTIKFSQLLQYNKTNIFLQKLCTKLGKETSSRPLYFLKKPKYGVKTSRLELNFNIM